jgi:hypothetical protein
MADWPPPDTGDGAVEPDRREGMPRWVKVSGLIVIVVVLVVVIVMVVGGGDEDGDPGPGRHGLGDEPAEQIIAEDAPGDHGSPEGGRR